MTSFFNSYIGSDMEPSVILISPKNKSPSDFWINESIYARILSFLVYIGFWIFILHGMMKWAPGGYPINIKIGFSVGFLLLLLYDFLYNYASQIMIDAQEKKFTEMNILSTNVVLDDTIFKLTKTKGLVIKNSVFEKLKRDKKLNSISIPEYRNSQYIKTLTNEGAGSPTPLAAYTLSSRLLLSGSYMFIIVMTGCIMASHHNKKLLAAMLPFATTSGVLAVAFISLWLIDRNYTSLITTEKLKAKIFITAFSFALTAIITPFFFV
jgi:hypothetical protein